LNLNPDLLENDELKMITFSQILFSIYEVSITPSMK